MLECLYEIREWLLQDMPQEGTNERKAINALDQLIGELEYESGR